MSDEQHPKVAIACQGGGSHAAFTAGVLVRLLDPANASRFELTALTGTSGGAVCASLAWAGLAAAGTRASTDARDRLLAFWRDLIADTPIDMALNFWSVSAARLPFVAEVSPYAYEPVAEAALLQLLRAHLRLEDLSEDARRRGPKLLIGATDILKGKRKVFWGQDLDYRHVVASAAVPPIYRAVKIEEGLYWDGLFSCNPPVRELTELDPRPDEIWVIRLNPRARALEPRTAPEIIDRRNELAGNLALDQELAFIGKINQLRKSNPALAERYKHIAIRSVELDDPSLDYPSKLDRSRDLIERLLRAGTESAGRLL